MTPEQVIRILNEADAIGMRNSEEFDASVGYAIFREELIRQFGNAFAEENPGFNRALFEAECWGE